MGVEPSAGIVEGLFRSRDMRLEIAAPEILPLEADPEHLRIALTNLLNNAAKYGREGGRAVLEVQRKDGEAAAASSPTAGRPVKGGPSPPA